MLVASVKFEGSGPPVLRRGVFLFLLIGVVLWEARMNLDVLCLDCGDRDMCVCVCERERRVVNQSGLIIQGNVLYWGNINSLVLT